MYGSSNRLENNVNIQSYKQQYNNKIILIIILWMNCSKIFDLIYQNLYFLSIVKTTIIVV